MKLYLSSYKFGDQPQQLANLIGLNKKIAIIPNALDIYPDGQRKQVGLQAEVDGLIQIGLEPEIVDLKLFFGRQDLLGEKLKDFGSVWVVGGNTFILRRAFAASGLDSWLLLHRQDRDFVYAGYSAGICLLIKDLKNIELMDQPHLDPPGYQKGIIWSGLGLVDFAIVPHFQSNHPESASASQQVDYLISMGVDYKTLSDGQVIIMEI